MKMILFFLIMLTTTVFTETPNKEKNSNKHEIFEDYYKEVIYNYLNGPDPTVEVLAQMQEDNQTIGMLLAVVNDLPGAPPYRLEMRRLKQFNPNRYHIAHDQQLTLNMMRQDGLKTPVALPMPPKSYLPGERVFWRISTQEGKVLKRIGCCPRPLILKNSNNEILMEAILVSANRPTTVYDLWFPPRKKGFDLIFHCGKSQKITIEAGGLDTTNFEPKIKGRTGGISTIEIISEGESYRIDLPWGTELEKY